MANFESPDDFEESEEDYYALLNLSKNASTEDINASYRRVSRLFHPDKHMDPVKKKDAEILFTKVKNAYEVLIDPHQRAIYDTVGLKGLQTQGWQIIERTKTAQEIREEYEQLVQEREERALRQRTNPKGSINIGINATDLFETYHDGLPTIEISSMTISQSVDAPLSLTETAVLGGTLSAHNGNGSGTVNCSLKKVFSANAWILGTIGAGNGLMFTVKGFRTIAKHLFGTVQLFAHSTDSGIAPGIELMLSRQLDKNTAGYLTYKFSGHSSVNTMIENSNEKRRYALILNLSPRNTFVTLSYTKKLENEGRLKGAIRVGVFGVTFEYGCDKKITQYTTLGAAMTIGVSTGVTLKIKISRASHCFTFPILLSEQVLVSPIFYGTAASIIGYHIIKSVFVDPYQRREKKRKADKEKEANAQRMSEQRKEASAAVSLMQETYKRIRSGEEARKGLIIVKAFYGSVDDVTNLNENEVDSDLDILDVTVPLQCLVKDSRLILSDRPKRNLTGFFDPCLGEDKLLRIDYTYRNINHSVTVKDNEMLKIPRLSDS